MGNNRLKVCRNDNQCRDGYECNIDDEADQEGLCCPGEQKLMSCLSNILFVGNFKSDNGKTGNDWEWMG